MTRLLVSAALLAIAGVAFVGLGDNQTAAGPPAAMAAPTAETPIPCPPTVRACVALGARLAWLRDPNGQVVFGPVPILPGSADKPTPTGDFAVTRKDIDHVSSLYPGVPMPYSVFFDNRGNALHEGSLTRPSAGCVHLDEAAAKRFFEALEIGDSIQIVP